MKRERERKKENNNSDRSREHLAQFECFSYDLNQFRRCEMLTIDGRFRNFQAWDLNERERQ